MADGVKRNIPVKLGDFSVIDTEFSNIRERFDAEMRKMEDEMTKFRSELMNRESNFFKTTTSFTSNTERGGPKPGEEERGGHTLWTESTESPLNDDNSGRKHSFTSHTEHRGSRGGSKVPGEEVRTESRETHSSSTSNTVSTGSDSPRGGASGGGPSTWLDSLNSPLIQDTGDNKCLKLRFDVSQYQPEEIVVKTVDNKLLVHAKHEEKSDSKSVYREYNREFLLPKGTNPESIKSSLSKDGVLTVEAPLPPALGQAEKLIPIAN